jgi:response regulator RpfG family c-di-GMP phosphodiesterase
LLFVLFGVYFWHTQCDGVFLDQILVVDDNLANLKNIQLQLSGGYNYQVVLAKSGAQALQICIQRIPDLILLDVDMPEMDGFEILSRIKGEAIPLCSRIMAVADVYDAVVADRIYRKAMRLPRKPIILLWRAEVPILIRR